MKLVPDVIHRLLGREVPTPHTERADRVIDAVKIERVVVVPKRDLAELRRLDALARRR